MCHGVHFGNPHGLLVGVFGRSREMNDARRFPRQKKSTRARLLVKGVERETRPRDAPRRRPRHARIARARDAFCRRSLVSRPEIALGFPPHLSTDSARTRDCEGSRHTFLARPTLLRSVARFLRTRFRLARRTHDAPAIPNRNTGRAKSERVESRCFSERCFSALARPSRR